MAQIMTAKEVLIRSTEISAELGRTYGQLQTELLHPLMKITIKQMEELNLLKSELLDKT